MFKKIDIFFDKLEDKVRIKLSHRSIMYAFIGGIATVLFWRGVWHTADIIMVESNDWGWIFYEPFSVIWTSIALLMTGLFVSVFIGERIIISGLKNEKKVYDKTEKEVMEEKNEISEMEVRVSQISEDIKKIKNALRIE